MISHMQLNIKDYETYSTHKKGLFCAELCNLAYTTSDYPQNKKALGINNELIDKISRLKYKSIQYHVYESPTHQFLVIRGTDTENGVMETVSDLWVSLKFFPTKELNGICCHGGYSGIGGKIIEQLCKKQIIKSNKKLVITGHSLGGAIAKYISTQIPKELELYTFGSPQVTDKIYYVYRHDVKELHYGNKYDLICSFPSTLYNDGKDITVIHKRNLVNTKIKRWGIFIPFIYLTLRTIFRGSRVLDDHAMLKYISNIEDYVLIN